MDVTKRPIGQETHGATSMGTRHNAHRPKTVLSTLKPGLGRDVCTILVRANRRGNILERSIMDVTKRPIGQETHGATSMGTRHNAHRPKIALSPMKPGCGRHVWHLRQSLLLPWNVPDARKEVHPPQDRTILPHGRWSNHFQNVYPKSSCSCGLISLFVATYLIDTLSFLSLSSFHARKNTASVVRINFITTMNAWNAPFIPASPLCKPKVTTCWVLQTIPALVRLGTTVK